MTQNLLDSIEWQRNPLIPAIVQDHISGDVLMLAYMNEEALKLSLQTHLAHYFSRSKQRIWKKGETSNNLQHIKEIYLDCDLDTILLKVEQDGGVACHTGRKSCFFNRVDQAQEPEVILQENTKYSIFDTLYHVVQERKLADPKTSYVASLLHKGENSILKKVVEEAGEFCFAIKDNKEDDIVYEAADLAFHTLVALGYKNINPDRIKQELQRRFGLSGIEEKNSR
ncbi:MAG: bifunctional phosphoribosyl-AMP cyclohydrolase/phosphoribosyl-ATP diphosphatase HisIE [Sulfurospirillum sp.]|nr:bifunctional phosphoribosyl-AMP cyclohydrolase/phosphoribosyl-ATP diphosphatase HisIE [Sulfurospirillum sp.]